MNKTVVCISQRLISDVYFDPATSRFDSAEEALASDFVSMLNSIGKDGWELVSYKETDLKKGSRNSCTYKRQYICIFKRICTE